MMDLSSLHRQLNWNSPWGTMAVRVIGIAANFGTLALIARLANQESLGLIIALNGAAFLGGTLFSLGIPTQLLRTLTGHLLANDDGAAAFEYHHGMVMVLKISLFGMLGVAAGAALQITGWLPSLGSIGPNELAVAGCCSLSMALQFVSFSALRALKQPALSGFFQFCSPPLLLLILLLALRLGLGKSIPTSAAIWSLAGASMINAGLVHFALKRRLSQAPAAIEFRFRWRDIAALWLLSVLSAASANIILLLAAAFLSPAQVALLGVPFRVCNLPMTVVSALGAYYAPLIREAHLQQDVPKQRRQLVESQWIGAVLVSPVLFFAWVAPELVLRWFSIHGPEAVGLFRAFAVAQTAIAACGVSEQYLAMLDQAGWAARMTQWSLAGIVLTALVLPRPISPLALALTWSGFVVARQVALWSACVWERKAGTKSGSPASSA